MIYTPQNIAVLCLWCRHQQNSWQRKKRETQCSTYDFFFFTNICLWLCVSCFTFVVESLVYFGRLLQGGGGWESRRQPNVNKNQEVGAGNALLGIRWSELSGAEVQTYTCAVHKNRTVATEPWYSLTWLATLRLTSMCYSHELAIWWLWTINNGNLDDGFEDRTINCSAKDK